MFQLKGLCLKEILIIMSVSYTHLDVYKRQVLTDGEKGMKGSIDKAMELREQIPDSFIPMQFNNPANPEIHEITTAEEIWTGGWVLRTVPAGSLHRIAPGRTDSASIRRKW